MGSRLPWGPGSPGGEGEVSAQLESGCWCLAPQNAMPIIWCHRTLSQPCCPGSGVSSDKPGCFLASLCNSWLLCSMQTMCMMLGEAHGRRVYIWGTAGDDLGSVFRSCRREAWGSSGREPWGTDYSWPCAAFACAFLCVPHMDGTAHLAPCARASPPALVHPGDTTGAG